MSSLFLNTSTLHNHYLDCCAVDVSETIERDCLSVLHKLHDQVNGLQLVQVVVQPLARLFNPASLAALASSNVSSSFVNNNNPNAPTTSANAANASSGGSQSQATTPSAQHPPTIGASHLNHHDLDVISTATTTTIGTSSLTNLGSTVVNNSNNNNNNNGHSRGHSFQTSAFNATGNISNSGGGASLLMSTTSTYMMSPDTAQALIARLDTDRDVNWLMEIIGYGLSMPFSLTGEQDSVKDCCTIYCEWLASALLPYNEYNEDSKYQQLSKLVPVPIRNDPNRYARKMLSHLYNVFLPRQTINAGNSGHKDHLDAQLTAVSRQAVLCHRVLRTIEGIAQNPHNLMDNQTWSHLLALLLTVNDKLLSGPTEPDDIGTQLHDRILGVLFELILLYSAKSIPTTGLWKTFHEMSLNWRHRPALVDHWRRITLLLTKRIVATSSSSTALSVKNTTNNINNNNNNLDNTTSSAIEAAIASLSYDNLAQTWYKFLNLLGNPVELSDPNVISRTDEFYHSACASDNVLDPRQHPCLSILPQIFMNSMAGLRDFIEAFLGSYQQQSNDENRPTQLDLLTPDRPPNYNLSARGSIVSLNAKTSTGFINTNQNQSSHQQQSQQQPQAVTPTQSRKSGIKSITMKGVMPFTSAAGLGPATTTTITTTTGATTPVEPAAHLETHHTKSGSISSQRHQQPRPSLASLSTNRSGSNQQQQSVPQFRLSPDRPKCNSILHIFGDWLFSAALIGSDLNQEAMELSTIEGGDCSSSIGSSSTTTEVSGQRSFSPSLGIKRRFSKDQRSNVLSAKELQLGKQHDSLSGGASTGDQKIQLEPPLSADSFELGQAEAMAILCKIFSSKSATEDISPTYLSRFYLCLQHCLTYGSGQDQRDNSIKRQLLSSVLVNSTTLLQKDLDGINLLIPAFIKAIEFVFECNEKENPIQPPPRQHNRSGSIRHDTAQLNPGSVNNYDLKRACILTLLNLLAYPFHFQELVIRNCLNESSPTTTFGSLRPRLLKLLFVALQTETDPTNMQILFGGLSLTIHDLAANAGKSASKDESKKSKFKTDFSTGGGLGGGLDSSPNSLDGSSHRRNDDNISQNSFVFNSSSGFLIKSLHVTCHLLINIWKHDTQVSLAALELLTTIARVSASSCLMDFNEQQLHSGKGTKMNNNNNNRIEMRNEYKQTTKWICDYICNQCSRPPPAHSRDMHSTIVAAYQCLSVWFYNHPYLLNDEGCVFTLMEVIELGVSGQKSKTSQVNMSTGLTTQQVISKSDKIMKPSSMRVREAAESLLNICMVRARTPEDDMSKTISSYDTVLDEYSIAELFGGLQHRTNLRQATDQESRRTEAFKLFKFFSDEDSTIFGLLEGTNHDSMTKDSVICLLRTPFGKHCWKMRFNYYTEKSRDKIIANKTLGLIKRPFQPCSTPTTDMRIFSFGGGQQHGNNKSSLYFNNSARFFPSTLDNLPQNDLDHLVTALNDYTSTQGEDSRLKNDLDKISKIYAHQVVAEQKVMSESTIRIKRVDCEEPQPLNDLEAARIIVTHLGWKTAISPLAKADNNNKNWLSQFVNDLKSLDHQSVRTCDRVNIFYVRKNRTSPKEILESVRERHNVSLSFFEWLLELGQPTVVKYHNRWTGKVSNSWNRNALTASVSLEECKTPLSRNQMLTSDHGGAIFDGDRMTIYWSDMCQELAFLVPHKIERAAPSSYSSSTYDANSQTTKSHPPSECELVIGSAGSHHHQQRLSTQSTASDINQMLELQQANKNKVADGQDHNNSDGQSLSSVASEASSHSIRTRSQQSSPRDPSAGSSKNNNSQREQKDNVSLSRQSVTAQKKKSTISSTVVGCDTNIIICWLECQDNMQDVPCDSLLTIAETGCLYEEPNEHPAPLATNDQRGSRLRDSVKYFISPMKNGLYRVNLSTSFGRHWLALPLVDGMTVSKGILSSLIRESVLNLCRRRRLDADCYQPPHVRRRIKIQDICSTYKISSRHESTEFYNNLFKSKGGGSGV